MMNLGFLQKFKDYIFEQNLCGVFMENNVGIYRV